MQAILATIVGALITGLVGNWLVQKWQLRNWFAQQRHSANYEELLQLTALFDEIAKSASARLNVMRALLNDIRSGADHRDSLDAYKIAISSWNVSLHSWFARITFLIDWDTTLDLEQGLHAHFVRVGSQLEALVRATRQTASISNYQISQVDSSLNSVAGQMDRFLKRVLAFTQERRDIVRNGRKIYYISGSLSEFSTLDLVKSLFVSDVDSFNIIRPS